MSKKRSIDTRFWDDEYITEKLDPIEKLLYLYLLTNPLTNMLGIYEISLRRIAFDTGIEKEMVSKIINRFNKDDKADYSDGHIILFNFVKNQSYNKNMLTSAQKDYERLPKSLKNNKRYIRLWKGLKGFGILRNIELEFNLIEDELEYDDSKGFEIFWDTFDKKLSGKAKCLNKWLGFPQKTRDEIMSFLPVYLRLYAERKYRPYPYTFLNSKDWENRGEIEQSLKEMENESNGKAIKPNREYTEEGSILDQI